MGAAGILVIVICPLSYWHMLTMSMALMSTGEVLQYLFFFISQLLISKCCIRITALKKNNLFIFLLALMDAQQLNSNISEARKQIKIAYIIVFGLRTARYLKV